MGQTHCCKTNQHVWVFTCGLKLPEWFQKILLSHFGFYEAEKNKRLLKQKTDLQEVFGLWSFKHVRDQDWADSDGDLLLTFYICRSETHSGYIRCVVVRAQYTKQSKTSSKLVENHLKNHVHKQSKTTSKSPNSVKLNCKPSKTQRQNWSKTKQTRVQTLVQTRVQNEYKTSLEIVQTQAQKNCWT